MRAKYWAVGLTLLFVASAQAGLKANQLLSKADNLNEASIELSLHLSRLQKHPGCVAEDFPTKYKEAFNKVGVKHLKNTQTGAEVSVRKCSAYAVNVERISNLIRAWQVEAQAYREAYVMILKKDGSQKSQAELAAYQHKQHQMIEQAKAQIKQIEQGGDKNKLFSALGSVVVFGAVFLLLFGALGGLAMLGVAFATAGATWWGAVGITIISGALGLALKGPAFNLANSETVYNTKVTALKQEVELRARVLAAFHEAQSDEVSSKLP